MPALRSSRRPNKARNPRKRTLSPALKRAARVAPPLGIGAAVVITGAWLVISGEAGRFANYTKDQALALSAKAGLKVENVLISGRARASRWTLERAAGAERGMPTLAFDPYRAKERLEMLAWVRTATVERRLPDTVLIHVAERKPLALWQYQGQLALIDAEGVVVTRWKLERFWKLPLVVGKGAPKKAAEMIRLLKGHPRLNRRLKALVRVSDRRWDLRFKNGIVARLPEKNAARALATLDRLDRRERLLDRDVLAIDLRYKDRLVVRTRAPSKGEDGKSKKHGGKPAGKPSKDT
ncbi:MAG: cell division protein FtsQ/DivIB [Alphaproteobacteria bacterium]|nr:cell division protein FtsQ/DivIB [Alphaproteobacteria bacterium]